MGDKDEEISRSVLSSFRAKEEEIEKKKMAVRERIQAQLGRVEFETKRLAQIREELEALRDPMRKEVGMSRKRIDTFNKELKPLGIACQKKILGESEKLRLKKLEELSKHIESLK